VTRVGAVDLGTNSTRLLVADVEDGRVAEVERRLAITRLGEGVDERGRLSPVAMARAQTVLADYRREAEALGASPVLVVATSAVREAENGQAFLGGLERAYGFVTRLLDGYEEAETTFRGVVSDRALERDTLVVDIGGGSTELLVGGPGGVSSAVSLQAGCVRMTERCLHGDPPGEAELDRCATAVRALLPPLEIDKAIGVAGTITTVAAIDLGLVRYDPARTHGHRCSRTAVDGVLARLAVLQLAERERVPGLEPARAPVIVAGLVILREVMQRYGLDAIEASERDILHGAALAAAELPERGAEPVPSEAHTRP